MFRTPEGLLYKMTALTLSVSKDFLCSLPHRRRETYQIDKVRVKLQFGT
uniref:Uncharacterized protein n=2 Tax=Anguilla anguilla TaxID=7936 RepID=A0A0E9QLB7_ANGAN